MCTAAVVVSYNCCSDNNKQTHAIMRPQCNNFVSCRLCLGGILYVLACWPISLLRKLLGKCCLKELLNSVYNSHHLDQLFGRDVQKSLRGGSCVR